MQEILHDLPGGRKERLHLRLSHGGLAAGLLEGTGLPEPAHTSLLAALPSWEGLPASQLSARLQAAGLPDQSALSLAALLAGEGGLGQLGSILRPATRRPGPASDRIKAGLAELRTVESLARGLGLTLDTVYRVSPALPPSIYAGLQVCGSQAAHVCLILIF